MEIKKELGKQHKDFRYLSDQDIQKLRDVSVARSYSKGQVLFDVDDDRSHVYFLVSGIIKLEKIDETGTFTYLHFKKAKSLLLYLDLFTDKKHYVSAVAYTDIEIISIPVKIFEEVVSNSALQLITVIQEQSKLLRTQIFKIQKGIINNADCRVTATLAIIYKDLGEKQYPSGTVIVSSPITINDIARASGTTRETASIVIKKLVTAKKIKYSRKYLTFLDTSFFNDLLND
ncbi:Crp/Fnr family transcriptional regulator [Vagococcus sp. DIV0080]|uniref:Crp/Fnr family transcriptional regulator n=1 Tax=Candidatus Vagococcus giribetii TaxID=2230876 RepID=A0ABS3HPA7_9ENTE|nr:Crp/Fnr family transcriptional regulator [Vagococcus sp. DIV0080]MBO0475576.1 Crp/Fnr family transcriptional regulator [Vagococcus sp. DIV0080]